MEIKYNVSGEKRKEMVRIIEEATGIKAVYMRVPTCNYVVGDLTITKDGALLSDETSDKELIDKIITALHAAGFESESSPIDDECAFIISIPHDGFTENGIENLQKIIESKSSLIKKALGADTLEIEISDDKISFPWFSSSFDTEEIQAYTAFIEKLACMAKDAVRINGSTKEVVNEKYAFRCFLLRLGFIGKEYKSIRKILLKNLSGSSAFKNGCPCKGGHGHAISR